jgi:deoxyribodipyrimidine photo-lyase
VVVPGGPKRVHPSASTDGTKQSVAGHVATVLKTEQIEGMEGSHSTLPCSTPRADAEAWTPLRLSEKADGRRKGWWGMSESTEAFLDQLITWRELGHGYLTHRPDATRYETLPDWARGTLEDHAGDPRDHTYSLREFEGAETHDAVG